MWDGDPLRNGTKPDRSVFRRLWSRWLGRRGEQEAARFLRRQGMKVLIRGYRTTQGEVDLICRDGDRVVFVEVKTRQHGHPAEAVNLAKERRLTLAALHFLRRYHLLETPCRFDVVAITWPQGKIPSQIEHFPGAFEAVGVGQFFR